MPAAEGSDSTHSHQPRRR
ncbi:Protein of unknown function [Gryllus bimaculatus]|nr:Protein of unknown function [Gryllus bimaculatus]